MANSGHGYVTKSAGTYAIVITGSDAGGDYKLYWNASNPAGAKYILNVKPDLSRIDLFYSNSKVCSNGTNILMMAANRWLYGKGHEHENVFSKRHLQRLFFK